jgi:hypothetical protein
MQMSSRQADNLYVEFYLDTMEEKEKAAKRRAEKKRRKREAEADRAFVWDPEVKDEKAGGFIEECPEFCRWLNECKPAV